MIRRTMLYTYIVVFLLISGNSVLATQLLTGNSAAPAGETFSFPIQRYVFGLTGDTLYVAAHPTLGAPQEFTLSAISRLDTQSNLNTKFTPLTPEKGSINGQDTDSSPLYNKHIAHLALMSDLEASIFGTMRNERPVIVLQEEPTSVYAINNFFGRIPAFVAQNVKDATGAPSAGIVGLGNVGGNFALAAVKSSAGGNFGAPGSGIAYIKLFNQAVKEGQTTKQKTVFEQIDPVLPEAPGVIRAVPTDVTSAMLKINGDLSAIGEVVKFHWDMFLQRIYVILQVQAGSGVNDGARAVFTMFQAQGDKLIIMPIAVDAAFEGAQNKIVGAIGANAQVSLHDVKTMWSSCNFPYLIVVGGNGSPSATKRTVYALPLVNNKNILGNGTIANKLEVPSLAGRGFSQPVLDQSQMTLSTDPSAQVGRGPVAMGDISGMAVRGDTVYVTVMNADAGYKPGVYYSQAILDARGAIQEWTEWKRVAGNTDQVYAADVDQSGNFLLLEGNSVDTVTVAKRTVWGTDDGNELLGGLKEDSSKGLVNIINSQLTVKNGGVQGLFDFPHTTPGLVGSSYLIATGFQKLVIANTGSDESGTFCPNFGDYLTDFELFESGSITKNLPALATAPRVVIMTGGELENVGPITCAEVCYANGKSAQGWLCVGGVGGVAILAQADGTGWNATTGLGAHFAGLTQGMAFKQVGNYSFVRKLICDNNFLYVLTDKVLDRINLATSNFATGALDVQRLATPAAITGLNTKDSFIDLLVTGKLAFLTSSKGLHRVGNGNDITTAMDAAAVGWDTIILPESVGPVMRLMPITVTGRAQDLANGYNGNLHVLNAYKGKDRAQLIRFLVNDVSMGPISDDSVQFLPDFHVEGLLAPLSNYNGYRDVVITDGSEFMNGESRFIAKGPFMQASQNIRSGIAFNSSISTTMPLNIDTAAHLVTMLRNSASGSWLVAGDFGVRVSE